MWIGFELGERRLARADGVTADGRRAQSQTHLDFAKAVFVQQVCFV